ncbi:TonB-dependent receptor [Pedobacter sp. SYSU D00535]|uniref:TonB-dependent receptor n=1 Tax=Pedobacter sp. SYSU D00535 TaxID=2810308 RepID=UPI001A97466F|nr:TonB-dependent receptor [Pedobacter sp. SYSU D00535]
MKLITILIFAGVMQIHAAGYSQNTFNLNEANTTVREMLRKIEKNSDYTVFYRHDQINLNQKVNVVAENASVETVMSQVLKNQPLTFEIVDQMIVIKSADTDVRDYTVTGTVTDTNGEPLIGASVLVKGTTRGASTDVNGRFSLTVPGDAAVTLTVTYLGYSTKDVTVSPWQRTIAITLTEDAAALEEVVVVGYGTVRKRDLTGSVASVKSEDITRVPTHNAAEAIQGRIPGADITRVSGVPGASANILIRGNKTIADRDQLASRNGPLYIIDGFQGGDISTINPNDIESIDVLKDASSTAIYGAQGANGVVIVTTKRGAAGKTKINYSSYFGVNDFIFPDLRSGDSYVQLRRDAGMAAGIWNSPADDPKVFTENGELEAYQNGQWIDWYDLIQRDGTQQSHSLTISGGNERTRIVGSLGYFNETGMFRNSDFNRYTGRFNLDQTINKWAKAGVQTQVTYSRQNLRNDPLGQAMTVSPLGTPYDEFGNVDLYPLFPTGQRGGNISPLADEASQYVARNNNLRTNIIANGYVELTPFKGLSFKSNLGTNFNFGRHGIFNDRESLQRYTQRTSQASVRNGYNRFLNWDNILTYNKEIADHNVTLTGITSYLQSDDEETFGRGINQVLSSQLFYNLASTSNSAGARELETRYVGWTNMAYAGRLNYAYKGRYLLTLSGRFDGSSRLSGKKWDFFPSAALGWNISDEGFFEKFRSSVSNLKLRASYGVSGNYNIQPYATQSLISELPRMGFGDVAAPGYIFEGTVGNPNLNWEKSAQVDLGLDLGLFNNRVSATFDYYHTVTSDILLMRQLPQSTGVVDVAQNIGEMQNRGIELSINSINVQNKNFRWSSTLTFSRNKEKITELLNGTDILATRGIEENSLLLGRPISSFYTYKKLGIWQQDEADIAKQYKFGTSTFQPGDIKLADLNGDKMIGPEDMTYIGSTVPKWVGGFQNTLSYKAFDLNLFLVARVGQTIDAEFLGRFNTAGTGNSPAFINYWTPENATNDFPRPYWGRTLSNYAGYQTLTYIDGSYVKLRNVTLGYTIPKSLTDRISAGRVRLYATASNVFTITKSDLIKDYDPERGGAESSPLARQFVFGINFDL